jgi:ABC-type sugar transport system ATPase subunit
MSAGQQRLVQLARTMVRVPDVFLIDEPFGALDASHRRQLRTELRSLQTGYEVTTVYATHDQEDAMALADLLAVVDRGRVRQIGTPMQVYRRPADTFVAQFIGSPEMSLLEATTSRGTLSVAGFKVGAAKGLPATVLVGVRPEDWRAGPPGVDAEVTSTQDVGQFVLTIVETEAGEIILRTPETLLGLDHFQIRPDRYAVFDKRSGQALFHSDP